MSREPKLQHLIFNKVLHIEIKTKKKEGAKGQVRAHVDAVMVQADGSCGSVEEHPYQRRVLCRGRESKLQNLGKGVWDGGNSNA